MQSSQIFRNRINEEGDVKRFADKIVIVTGAGSGIGKETAKHFAREGAQVILVGRNMERLELAVGEIENEGGRAAPVQADVSIKEQVEAMVSQVVDAYGKIDVLHNHAGILSAQDQSILEVDESVMDATLANNVKSQMMVGKYVGRVMASQKRGSIVNTASDLSFIALPNVCCYVTSKGAILGLTRAMAVDLGPYNIRVNAVCPGFVYDTIMTEGLASQDSIMEEMKKSYIIKKLGRPSDIAPTVLHLASDDSGFTTGSFVIIDGGHIIT